MGQRVIFNETTGSWAHDVVRELNGILKFINEFSKGSDLPPVKCDLYRIKQIVLSLSQSFPHRSGVKRASIFKKVSFFATQFISAKPISEPFPIASIGSELGNIPNHQNTIIAFQIAIDSLHKAKIIRDSGEELILENRIEVSEHSYIEIIEALSEVDPSTHDFKLLCVFFEQLAYKTNPHCQYPIIET